MFSTKSNTKLGLHVNHNVQLCDFIKKELFARVSWFNKMNTIITSKLFFSLKTSQLKQ